MSKNRILPTIIGITLLAIALPLALTSQGEDTPVPERSNIRRVRTAVVEASSSPRSLRFPGSIRSESRTRASFQISGRIAQRPVEIGDRAIAGTTLARLDERELHNQRASARGSLAQIEARLQQARLEMTRVQNLHRAGAATQEELEQAQAALDALAAGRESAAAQAAEAERRLQEARLIAPFSGIVSQVFMEVGEYAGPGSPVVEISGDGRLEVEVGVPENLLPKLEVGSPVAVELPMVASRPLAGTLRSVGRAAGASSLFPVVVALEEGTEAAAGMTAEVILEADDGLLTTVPLRSVLNPGGSRPVVFRLDGDRAEQVSVEIDRLVGERVAVRGPLSAGDRIITEGHLGLVDGDVVEVRQ